MNCSTPGLPGFWEKNQNFIGLPDTYFEASQVTLVVNNLPAIARDESLFPGLGRSPGEENGSLLQYSCLGNSMNRGVWWATVHGVSKSRTWHKDWVHMHTMTCPFMAVLPHYQSYFFKALNKSHIWAHPNEAWDWMKRQQGALYICLFSSMLAIL